MLYVGENGSFRRETGCNSLYTLTNFIDFLGVRACVCVCMYVRVRACVRILCVRAHARVLNSCTLGGIRVESMCKLLARSYIAYLLARERYYFRSIDDVVISFLFFFLFYFYLSLARFASV